MNFPPLPDVHAIAVLVLVVVALVLFTRERLPLESSSLAVLALLAAGFELFPYTKAGGERLHAVEFFHGFGHEALVAVAALMIAGQGLVRTGALEPVGRLLARMWQVSALLSLALTLVLGAALSAFVNNVPIVILLLPILVSVALRTGTPASGVLMPMGFATIIGGMATTIGTSTNLLVVSVAADMGLPRFAMFDFTLPVAIAGGAGLLYLWLIAPRLLPQRETSLADASPRVFSAQINLPEESAMVGKTLGDAIGKTGGAMHAARVQRGRVFMIPLPDLELQAGDRLLVNDTPENLKEFEQVLEGRLYAGDAPVDDDHPLKDENQQIAEVVVVQGSPLIGSTMRATRFADRYQLVTLALHRAGRRTELLGSDVGDVRLGIGDVLLVQGAADQIAGLKRGGELLVLDATADVPHTDKARIALIIMAAMIALAGLGILPIAISAVCGVLAMLLSGCMNWREATQALSAQVVLIVVASLALGVALLQTGGADYLAQVFVALSAGASPAVMVSGLMLLMAVLTNVVSNNAAAVIGTPIGVSIAAQVGMPPEAFVLAVLFGANMSFATPMAYKTNLLVMNTGGYRFTDFVRVGVPLTVIMWLMFSWLLPRMYGF